MFDWLRGLADGGKKKKSGIKIKEAKPPRKKAEESRAAAPPPLPIDMSEAGLKLPDFMEKPAYSPAVDNAPIAERPSVAVKGTLYNQETDKSFSSEEYNREQRTAEGGGRSLPAAPQSGRRGAVEAAQSPPPDSKAKRKGEKRDSKIIRTNQPIKAAAPAEKPKEKPVAPPTAPIAAEKAEKKATALAAKTAAAAEPAAKAKENSANPPTAPLAAENIESETSAPPAKTVAAIEPVEKEEEQSANPLIAPLAAAKAEETAAKPQEPAAEPPKKAAAENLPPSAANDAAPTAIRGYISRPASLDEAINALLDSDFDPESDFVADSLENSLTDDAPPAESAADDELAEPETDEESGDGGQAAAESAESDIAAPQSRFNFAVKSASASAADAGAKDAPALDDYVLPQVAEILAEGKKRPPDDLAQEINAKAEILARTLENFRVSAKIVDACHGPAVTRFEVEPAPGVKVSKIANLAEDLALALASVSVRIEPIPGKAAIGIEVPNAELEGVGLREVLADPAFAAAESKLTCGIGKEISGEAVFADIAAMPHLLVAGATGSGKSVCINTLITSILFKARPDEVKFILIDPKIVELSIYNGIPHLMAPVVTDAKKAAAVLGWAVQEMERRYGLFAASAARDIKRYNRLVKSDGGEYLPSIVIIIDELADLMMVAPREVEDAICRIAQKARAAGIHLVLATQRPSVDVITGIIKANIPSRISFAVSSQIDSRTILDASGAEKLLGKGDMLFAPSGTPKPRRVQGAFVSDDEVEKLLDFIRAQGQAVEFNQEIIDFAESDIIEEEPPKKEIPKRDDLLAKAVSFVLANGQASASGIQRRFHIGYTRAARLIDLMEAYGIVGPSVPGNKPREILLTLDEALDAIGE